MTQQPGSSRFELEFPQSVGVFSTYQAAQKAVDFLADEKFPVENLAIVGTDLRLMERVTGRRTWGTVVRTGILNGVSTGLLVALLLLFLFPETGAWALFPAALAIGIVISVGFSALAYALSGGRRDFDSVAKTVATKYEIMCEHKVAAQARDLLATMPGARSQLFE